MGKRVTLILGRSHKCGAWAIFESMIYLFGAGFRPRPVTAHFQHLNIPSSKCLHSILPCVSVPADWYSTRYLGDATEGQGKRCELAANTRRIQTGRCSGPGRANRCMTVGLCRGCNCASKNTFCLLLVFDLNRLSLNQKQWHI